MSMPIKRIEKDFMINMLYNEQIPIIYLHNRKEYILKVEKYTKDKIYFKSDRPIGDLVTGKTIELIFKHNTLLISFTVEMNVLEHGIHVQENHFVGNMPEFLYKDLDRSYRRVSFPRDMEVKFTLAADQYILPFPKVSVVESFEETDAALEGSIEPDIHDFNGVLAAIDRRIKNFADGYKVVLFDETPLSFEEQLIAKNGKALFLPSMTKPFPSPNTSTYPGKYLITEEQFKEYLKSTGVNPTYFDKAIAHFFDSKKEGGILADLWVPLFFKNYVVGALRVWIKKAEKVPLDYTVIAPLYRYAQSLVLALKEKGYFEAHRIKDTLITATGIDISSSGLRFTYPHSAIASSMTLNSTVALKLLMPKRTINVNVQIVRSYKKRDTLFFGCRFLDISPEDMRFLFEYIYGTPFTELGTSLISGHV
ncbi:MAG: PilZ domain-containing protein [Treponema sp.]|jgi:c-di-GMP-binding flagellar brake protein YcgR|nr:PilZ domain-containing protein [Treponema sp.]